MARGHAFHAGLPGSIVDCSEVLGALHRQLDSLPGLHWKKTLRDRNTLRDRTREKQHRRISLKNSECYQFYVISYLELGKSWLEVQSEDDQDDGSDGGEHPSLPSACFAKSSNNRNFMATWTVHPNLISKLSQNLY